MICVRYPKARGRPTLQKRKVPKTYNWRSEILHSVLEFALGRKEAQWAVPVYKGTYVPPEDERQSREEIMSKFQSRFSKE